MLNRLLTLCALCSLALPMTACTPENNALNMPPGTYKNDVKSTNANGVTTEHKTSTDVSVDQNGNKQAVVESKTTERPPGFFNGLFHTTTTDQSTQVMQQQQ